MMNDHQVRNWSAAGWKYNFYDSVSGVEKTQSRLEEKSFFSCFVSTGQI
jgi:hypothetical protein